jgi:hypothetical protein
MELLERLKQYYLLYPGEEAERVNAAVFRAATAPRRRPSRKWRSNKNENQNGPSGTPE